MEQTVNGGTQSSTEATLPATETVVSKPITLADLELAAEQAADESYAIRKKPGVTEAEKVAASQKSYAADKAVRDFIANAEKLELQKKYDLAKTGFIGIKDQWYAAKLELDKYLGDLSKIAVGKRTAEQNGHADELNKIVAELDAKLTEYLGIAFPVIERKKDHPIPMGMTGTQLAKQNAANANTGNGEKTSKSGIIKAAYTKKHFGEGKTVDQSTDEIVAETGYDRKSVNDIKWAWEIANGLREKPTKK